LGGVICRKGGEWKIRKVLPVQEGRGGSVGDWGVKNELKNGVSDKIKYTHDVKTSESEGEKQEREDAEVCKTETTERCAR